MLKIIRWFFLGLILLWFHLRGLSINDSGYVIHSAQRILRGEIIYKDFDFVYTPFSVFLTTVFFKIFNQSILVERMLAFIISFLTFFTLLSLFKLITNNRVLIVIGEMIFLFWGPTHINFLSPVMLSLSLSIFALYLKVRYLKINNPCYLFYLGTVSGLVFLTKQNFGAMLILNILIFFFINKIILVKRNIFYYLAGFFIPLIFFFIYLLITNSFTDFFNNFYFYTIKKIIIEGALTTPFFYQERNIFYQLAKTFFYLSPLIISILAIILNLKKKEYIFLPTLVILFYFVSLRPETDFVHLTPILSLTGISFIFLIRSLKEIFIKRLFIFYSLILIIIGFYSALFIGYYRWEQPLIKNNYWNNHPKIMIWNDGYWLKMSKELQKLFKQERYLFINANASLLYFISDKKNPTRFDFITPYANELIYQEEIISNLKEKNVFYVLTNKDYQKERGLIIKFIKKNYQPVKVINNFVLWKKLSNFN